MINVDPLDRAIPKIDVSKTGQHQDPTRAGMESKIVKMEIKRGFLELSSLEED